MRQSKLDIARSAGVCAAYVFVLFFLGTLLSAVCTKVILEPFQETILAISSRNGLWGIELGRWTQTILDEIRINAFVELPGLLVLGVVSAVFSRIVVWPWAWGAGLLIVRNLYIFNVGQMLDPPTGERMFPAVLLLVSYCACQILIYLAAYFVTVKLWRSRRGAPSLDEATPLA